MSRTAIHRQTILGSLVVLLVLWLGVAGVTFQIRHPWSTNMQFWFCVGKALTFQSVEQGDCNQP